MIAINTFIKGINVDVADLLLESDSYRYALNCIAGRPDKSGAYILENEKGNERVPFVVPSGTNICIGACPDEESATIYFFLYNSNGDHTIFEHHLPTNTIAPIVYPPVSGQTRFLNFQPDKHIINAKYIRVSNDVQLLYWTDGYFVSDELPYSIQTPSLSRLKNYSPPRCLNVMLAKRLTRGLSGEKYPASFYTGNLYEQNQYTDAIRYPSVYAPTGRFLTDVNKAANYFREKKPAQYRIRYKYLNGDYSVWGGISEVVLPANDEFIDNYQGGSISINNQCRITYQTGHPSAVEIDIAVRFGNTGVWYKIDAISKYDKDGNVVIPSFAFEDYDFYNNKVLTPISVEQSSQPYDYVPIAAGCQEFISTSDTSVFGYGDIIEGRELPEPDVTIEKIIRVGVLNKWTSFGGTTGVNVGTAPVWWEFNIPALPEVFVRSDIPIGEYFVENAVVSLFTSVSGTKEVIITAQDVLTVSNSLDVANWIRSKFSSPTINISSPAAQIRYGISGWRLIRLQPGAIVLTWRVPLLKYSELRRGANHTWGIIYEDEAGRMSTVVPIGATYIPTLTEEAGIAGTTYTADTYPCARVVFTINHRPPSWARKWRVAYGGNDILRSIQISPASASVNNGVVEWDISNYTGYLESIQPTSLLPVVPTENDRARLLVRGNGVIETSVIDLRVLSANTTADKIITNLTDISNYSSGGLIEYYAYKKTNTIIYNEFSQAFDVLFNGTEWFHAGTLQNQTASQPCIVELGYGDTYIKRRRYYNSYPAGSVLWDAPIADANYSDFYESADINIGRVNLFDPNYEQRNLYSSFRFSRNFIFNTGVIGLNSFNENDIQDLSSQYGRLTIMRMVGYVLKCLQTDKNTSIYIQRRQVYSADGSPMLATTDATIGSVNVSDDAWGCQHPESAVVFSRHLYYYDHTRGVVVRDAPNGQYPISIYGIATYLRDKSMAPVTARAAFDKNSFRYVLTLNEDTLSFDESNNAWRSFHSYHPEEYGAVGIYLVSYRNSEVWVHYSDNVPRCSFYGVKYRQKVRFLAKADPPLQNKIADSIEVHANKKWEATDGTGGYGITTQPNDNYPIGMKSRLVQSKFAAYENYYTASFLFDANTPNMPTEEFALLNGRRLRSYWFEIQLENEHDEYVFMSSVVTKCTPSL